MEEVTAGNRRGQLVGSGVWVQVAEIFKTGQKIQIGKVKGENPTHAAHEWATRDRPGA
jgi:hypothetical protein